MAMEKSAEILKVQACVWNQLFCFKNSACLKCAVQLGIPDAIDNHGKAITLSELTDALLINPSKACCIHRLMRILVNAGFFVEERLDDGKEDKAYALAPPGHLLLKNNPQNVRELVFLALDPVLLKPWNFLSEWFQNDDQSAFETAHGKKLWDYTSEEPKFCMQLNEAMASDSKLISELLISEYKFVFDGLPSMVDVGGGTGTVSRAIARMFPGLKCTVYDLPHVVADLEGTKNLDFVAGDMFDKIPSANAILLKVETSFSPQKK
jgi:trans-resveratrol di-O-methyltransferase